MASNAAQHNQLLALFAVYAKKLDKLYDDFITRLISSLPYSEKEIWEKLAQDPLFRFDELPYMSARLQHIFNDFVNNQVLCYKVRNKGKSLAGCIADLLKEGFSNQWTVPKEILSEAKVSE